MDKVTKSRITLTNGHMIDVTESLEELMKYLDIKGTFLVVHILDINDKPERVIISYSQIVTIYSSL